MKTLQQRYITALELRGRTVVKRNPRYVIVSRGRTVSGKDTFWFVGNRGSLRHGTCYTRSVPTSEAVKAQLLGVSEADLDAVGL